MKVLTIIGSPHKQGNTSSVLGFVEDELKAKGAEVERVDLSDEEIEFCMACYHCQQKSDEPFCVHEDDMVPIYDKMIAADAIVFASPLHMWGSSSRMTQLLERCIALVTGYMSEKHNSLIAGKKTALVVTCGGPQDNNCDYLPKIFEREMNFARTKKVGELVVPFCTTPDKLGDDAKAGAVKLAHDILK